MKQGIKKMMTMAATLALATAMCCSLSVAASVLRFSDVTEQHWGYETIMDMTEAGLFKGTTEPVNGVAQFSPNKVMTRAEFVTVAVRAIYPQEAQRITNDSEQWWKGYYVLALEKGLLKSTELNKGDLSKSMSRQEMAMVMVRCVEQNGEALEQRVDTSRIADYATINTYYKNYVLDCFSYGLLCGVDEKGTFAPSKSLTRAEAATVLCRLVDKEMRVDLGVVGNTGTIVDGKVELPWENGGKQPENYTWAEFEALSPAQQIAFQNSFSSYTAFEAWMDKALSGDTNNPWDNGGKQPSQYTWAEFELLPPAQQMAFQNSFGSIEKFEEWMLNAKVGISKNPWENGGKQPSQYTWAEFEALTPAQQIAFQNTFRNSDAFEAWMNDAQSVVSKNPWDNSGKRPSQYTWAEFEALTPAQQIAFQNSFGSIEEFDKWLTKNEP